MRAWFLTFTLASVLITLGKTSRPGSKVQMMVTTKVNKKMMSHPKAKVWENICLLFRMGQTKEKGQISVKSFTFISYIFTESDKFL